MTVTHFKFLFFKFHGEVMTEKKKNSMFILRFLGYSNVRSYIEMGTSV